MENNCLYYMEGLMRIPEKKQNEMNEIVMKLLIKGGIRKLRKMKLAGKEVEVVDLPSVDRYGKIRFDYSIYEERKRDTGWYNTKDGTLCVTDRGYSEYGLIMNLIMTVQEAFSETQCYLMYDGKPSALYGYVEMIETMIGEQLVFPFRESFWDEYCFFKRNETYKNLKLFDLARAGFAGNKDLYYEELFACIFIEEELRVPESPIQCSDKLKEASNPNRMYYAYEQFKKALVVHDRDRIVTELRRLLEGDYVSRDNLAKDETFILSEVAKVSLYELSPVIVSAFGHATGEEFWQLWDEIGGPYYCDIFIETEDDGKSNASDTKIKKKRKKLTLYRAFQRDCEDEFIDNWEGERLDFSEALEQAIADWGDEYSQLEDDEIEGVDIEEMLAEILSLVYEEWKCRYVDKSFVMEFVKNKNKIDYKKAIALYYMLATSDVEYFPELTETQALCMISYLHDKEDRIQLSAFASLLSNKIHRKEIFGF